MQNTNNPLPDGGDQISLLRLPVGKQLDPTKYRPKIYVAKVVVGEAEGDAATGSVSIDGKPFLWTKTTFSVEGNAEDDQDYRFLVAARNNNEYYQNQPARPEALFGNPHNGPVIPWDVPVWVSAKNALYFDCQNLADRGEGQFIVEFCCHGFERYAE